MTVTTTSLFKAAGAAAAVAGGIFIAVQVNHPPHDAFTTETTPVGGAQLRQDRDERARPRRASPGMYLRQHRQAGRPRPGRLPPLRRRLPGACSPPRSSPRRCCPSWSTPQPGFVNDVVASAVGAAPEGDIGSVQVLFNVTGVGYMLGGLVFGIALFRSGVLARWAAALLAVSTHRDRLPGRAAGGVRPPDGRPGGHRADRPRASRCGAAPGRPPPSPGPARPGRRERRAMTLRRTAADRPAGSAGWAVPAALVALSVIPLTAGAPAARRAARRTGRDAGRRPVHVRLPGRADRPPRRRRRLRAGRRLPDVGGPAPAPPGLAPPRRSRGRRRRRSSSPGRRCG